VGDTFTSLSGTGQAMNFARAYAVAALLPNGEVLIAGGEGSGGFLSSAELFSSAAQAAVTGGTFGAQTVGGPPVAQALVVTNIGAQALSISADVLSGPNATDFAITGDACAGQTLAFKQTCTITVQFKASVSGTRSATLAVTDNEATPASVALSGTGIAPNIANITHITIKNAEVTAALGCTGTAAASCSGALTLTTTEHKTGSKLTAVTAKTRKPKHTTHVLTVGSASYTIADGTTEQLTLTLNTTGKKLLAHFHKLPATLNLTPTGDSTPTATQNITITVAKHKHKHKR
jgi:hypothetical protein